MTKAGAELDASVSRPRLTGGNLYALARCERRLWLDAHESHRARPPTDFELQLRERARAHARRVREGIPGLVGPILKYGEPLAPAAEETRRLLRESRAPLDQPVFLSDDGARVALPALLYWDEGGAVIADIRLAESVDRKPEIPLQLAHAAALMEETTGITPSRLEIIGGKGLPIAIAAPAREAYEAAAARAKALLDPEAAEPALLQSHSECEGCPYYEHCWSRAERERWVQVLPSVQKRHVPILAALGVRTLEDLTARTPESLEAVKGLGKFGRLMAHEARAFATGGPVWMATPQVPPGRPAVWFDIETDPDDETHGIAVYLWGIGYEGASGGLESESVLRGALEPEGGDPDEEVWRRFLARAAAVIARWPDAPWLHYANNERTWVRKYAERWGDPDGTAALLLERLFDLHAEVVAKSLRLPLRSYGIKHVAKHLGFEWSNPEAGSQWSVVQYRRACRAGDPAERTRLLDEIVRYNADDLGALRTLWIWLESTRVAGAALQS